MISQTKLRTLIRTFLLIAILAMSITASAQSCALCYTQAAGAGPRVIQALKSGILVLIFPPMLICTGLIIAGYRKRNNNGSTSANDQSDHLGW
jgi:hypothetical protein